MVESALGTAFSLLLLTSVIQGFQDLKVFHYEKMEAVVGQAVVLPCTLITSSDLKIVSIEWSKNINNITKLALYSPTHGVHLFWNNVSIQIENKTLGSHLHLTGVSKWDSGVYICEMATFPLGIIRTETQLEVKDVDVEIICDANSPLEVHAGENVTIHCTALPNMQYRWTKNKKLVSENESLELYWVTDAHRGAYTLTVNTGNKTLQKEFTITVLTATTSLNTVFASPTTGPSTVDTNVTWSMGTDVTDDNPNPKNVTTTTLEHTKYTHISVASAPATHTGTSHFNKSNYQSINLSHTLNMMTTESMQHVVLPEVTSSTFPVNTSIRGSIMENSDKPGATPTLITGNTPDIEDADGARIPLLLRLIIVPALILIVVAAFLYTKQITRQREKLVRKNTSKHLMASNQNNHRRVRFNHCSHDVAGEAFSAV